jgi:hypothetical protein
VPAYTYTGDPGRYYPRLGLSPEPGGSYELDANPGDGRFEPPDPKPEAAPATAPEQAEVPAPTGAGASTAAKKRS